jgi:hypothetical protein
LQGRARAVLWSGAGAIGAGLYLLVFLAAAIYPWFDHKTFAGLAAVMLAWPWIDYFPSSLLLVGVLLNAVVIYVVLAVLSFAPVLLRGLRR